MTLRLVVLLSGTGRTLANFLERRSKGRLPAEVVGVISSHETVRGCQIATSAGIPLSVVKKRQGQSSRNYGLALAEEIDRFKPDLVAMAGFVHLWEIPATLAGRVMNVHPALLPAFGGKGYYGHHVHEAVARSGVRFSGCTVHFADNEYDHGPIILQRVAEILWNEDADSIARKVLALEFEAYPEAISLFAEDRLRIHGLKVEILPPRNG